MLALYGGSPLGEKAVTRVAAPLRGCATTVPAYSPCQGAQKVTAPSLPATQLGVEKLTAPSTP